MRSEEALSKIEIERIVDNRTYTDLDVFEAEIERIFGQVWTFACHDSELRDVGDYLAISVAGDPVVVCRDRSRRIRAYFNTCRHRGSTVVTAPEGNCAAFRCPYHSWVYSLEGDLVRIPGEEAYDGTGFHKENFPLVELACESVFGLVFVHPAPNPTTSLESWLGPEVIDTLATPLAHGDLEVFQTSAGDLPINWKVFAENTRDGYHVPFVHPFFRKASPPGTYRLHRNGHAVQELGMDPAGIEPELWATLRQAPLPGVEVGDGYIVNVFPDLAITLRSNVVSIDGQRVVGPRQVVLENRTIGLVGDTPAVRAVRALSQRTWFADPVLNEDVPVFLAQQRGVAGRRVRHSVIARGAHATEGTRGDDNRLRHFWVEWRALMGVSANSLDPDAPGRR